MGRIQDILDAIVEIQSFTMGMDFESFRNDPKTIRAVELDFIIVGEAANLIPEEVQKIYPGVPWKLMRGMRNRLVHVYFSVDLQLLWDTIQNDLPVLQKELKELV